MYNLCLEIGLCRKNQFKFNLHLEKLPIVAQAIGGFYFLYKRFYFVW